MKLTTIIFGMFFTIFPPFTYKNFAQNKTPLKNYLNFQITQPLFGEYQLGYERMFTKRISLELIGSKQSVRNASEVRSPDFYGTLNTDGIYLYENLKWTKFNKSQMIELAGKYYFMQNIYISASLYYRECETKNGNWHYMTSKSMDNQYWINADINTYIRGFRVVCGKRFIAKVEDKFGLYIEPYTGLGYRYTKGNILFHKFEEKITPTNNKYNFSETRIYEGVTIHLGAKIGVAFL